MLPVLKLHRLATVFGLVAWFLLDHVPAADVDSVRVTVRAGSHARQGSFLCGTIPRESLGPRVLQALQAGPVALRITELDATAPDVEIAQLDQDGKTIRVGWSLTHTLEAGATRSFRLDVESPQVSASRWTLDRSDPGAIVVAARAGDGGPDHRVFRYNVAPQSSPNYKAIQNRDGYLHPVYTPTGALITGDFSSSHPHHRGIFLAYAAAQIGDTKADFWNIHTDRGKISFDHLDRAVAGPLTARIQAHHRWEVKEGPEKLLKTVLREGWDLEVLPSSHPGTWLFDLTSTQEAMDRPFDLTPYRYGGMAYRGAEPFVKGELDVLTSEGKHRKDGDQKPTRWVDLTGPVADNSTSYAGAMIADHPGNPHTPTVARIHPTTLPFFSFVPAHDRKLTILSGQPAVFRYRVLVHDGRPDRDRNEQVWRDFAEPPEVTIEPAP